jgi:hypothetical protein
MGRATVGMITSYNGIRPQDTSWLWHQTPHPFGQWGNIQLIANHPQPDYMLLYQVKFDAPQPQRRLRDRVKFWQSAPAPQPSFAPSMLRGVPPERAIYLLREPPLDEVVSKHQRFYQAAQNYCGYVSGPDDFAPVPDYMPAIWYVLNPFRELNEMPPPEKVKPCSWITSGIDRSQNHRDRLAFLQLLRQSGLEFDLYGRNLPDWSAPRGEVGNKWFALAPYSYNLAIENYADNEWYVSEKLWDALLSWCLPIYYGGSAADKLLPPGSFLRLPSLDEKGLAYIQDVTSSLDAWYEAKEAIAEARQIILHKLNLVNWLSEFVEKQES